MREKILDLKQFDLASPDGCITKINKISETEMEAKVFIENISPAFAGFQIDSERVEFNLKSTLAQLGIDGIGKEILMDREKKCAEVNLTIKAIGKFGVVLLKYLDEGSFIGKLFAADERRRVRNPDYLGRMFGRSDRQGKPLLSLGGMHGSADLILDKIDGRTVAYISLQNGRFEYEDSIFGFLPTVAKALKTKIPIRDLLRLHQEWKSHRARNVEPGELLLVRTLPLHVRTVFGRVVNELLSAGFVHTTASILQPNTEGSGDIYELYGNSKRELTDIPLEFYTLEPYREHVFFSDRDQLQSSIEDHNILFRAFQTAPKPLNLKTAVFIVKGKQLLNLTEEDWIVREPRTHEFPGPAHEARHAVMVNRYLEQQASYPFLKFISEGYITSQGILLTRYFPSPLMKRLLISDRIQLYLKGIYFQYPSLSFGEFFSAEDRSLLHDLYKFAIPVFWVDEKTQKILQFLERPGRDSGLFVPIDRREEFLNATVFGIYGSNLFEGDFEYEIKTLLEGILKMRTEVSHPLLSEHTPLALVSGGGPGAMAVGNRIAKELEILSCANIVDFRMTEESVVNEQTQNPYVEAKMTYRLDKLVERQAEFHLDFPIFLVGGIGTDFEYTLEEVKRKVGANPPYPVLLLGSREYWQKKVTTRFQCNVKSGTTKGSEWLSNCYFCIENAEQGLKVYRRFFENKLPIGPDAKANTLGMVIVEDNF